MSALSFTSYCGVCFSRILPSKGGVVLSCGDFICSVCISTDSEYSENCCSACGRKNVKSLKLNAEMPEDVLEKMNDMSNEFEILQDSFTFQVKHYKRVLASSSSAMQQKDKEINMLKRY